MSDPVISDADVEVGAEALAELVALRRGLQDLENLLIEYDEEGRWFGDDGHGAYGLAEHIITSNWFKQAGLCSQCGDQPSVMVKIGTFDGWCVGCLDDAAESRPTVDDGQMSIPDWWSGYKDGYADAIEVLRASSDTVTPFCRESLGDGECRRPAGHDGFHVPTA